MNGYVYATLVRTLARSHAHPPRSFTIASVAFKVIQGRGAIQAANVKNPQLAGSWGFSCSGRYVDLAPERRQKLCPRCVAEW
jgi:hypothetical protein